MCWLLLQFGRKPFCLLPFCSPWSNPCLFLSPTSVATGDATIHRKPRGVWDKKKNSFRSGLRWQRPLGAGCTLSDLDIQKELSLHATQRHTFLAPRKRWSLTPRARRSHLKGKGLDFFLLKYCEEQQNASPSLDIPSWEWGRGFETFMGSHLNN